MDGAVQKTRAERRVRESFLFVELSAVTFPPNLTADGGSKNICVGSKVSSGEMSSRRVDGTVGVTLPIL